MTQPKRRKTKMFGPAVAPWLVRASAIVQLATAIVALVGAIVTLLARLGLAGLR